MLYDTKHVGYDKTTLAASFIFVSLQFAHFTATHSARNLQERRCTNSHVTEAFPWQLDGKSLENKTALMVTLINTTETVFKPNEIISSKQ